MTTCLMVRDWAGCCRRSRERASKKIGAFARSQRVSVSVSARPFILATVIRRVGQMRSVHELDRRVEQLTFEVQTRRGVSAAQPGPEFLFGFLAQVVVQVG